MAKTASGLVMYAIMQLGKPYWYATYGAISSESLYKAKKKQYPAYYTASNFSAQYGQRVHDCVGIIKGYHWSETPDGKPKYKANGFPDTSANGLYNYCKKKGTNMRLMPDVPGVLVFLPGHVGVYIGNGYVVEARGHAYGVVKTKLSGRGWKKWAYDPDLEYDTVPGTGEDVTTETPTLCKGDKNEHVKRMQTLLQKWSSTALPKYGTDGDFGSETLKWVKAFQKAAGVKVTGIVDFATWAALEKYD